MVKEMTAGSPLRLIFNFSMPLILGNLLQQTYNLIDASIVGRFLGIRDLAAVGASTSVTFLIIGFCLGCCCGFGIPVAQTFGAHRYKQMRSFVYNALWLAVIISVTLTLVTTLSCGRILRSMQTPDEIFRGAYIYLLVTFLGIPFTFLYNLLAGIIRALGDSKTPFWFLLFSTLLNIVLDLLFILVFGWGVGGAAVATVTSQGLSAVLCLVYMFRKFDILRMEPDERRLRRKYALRLLGMGIPMGLQFSITAIGSIMLQSSNNALGTACVAAFTTGMRIKMFFICPFESLGIAMATYCGQNLGAGRLERIGRGLKAAFFMVVCYCVFCFAVLHLYARPLAMWFVEAGETEILDKACQFLYISSTYYVPLGTLCLLRYSIQGLGFSRLAMLSGVFEMVDRAAVSLWIVPAMGYTGVCYGDPSAWFAACLFLIPAYRWVIRRLRSRSRKGGPAIPAAA